MLNYIDIGEGEELVLIHGLGNQREAWDSQYSLSKSCRLILIELRGHGKSVEVKNLTVETFAKDVIEVLDRLNIKKAHICGLSLGGIIAQEIYKRYKDRVKSLILCNTTFYIPYFTGKMTLLKNEFLFDQMNLDQYKDRLVRACLYNHEDEENIELAKNAFCIRKDTYFQSFQSAFGRNYFMNLLNINVPTLIIGSTEDKITPVESAYFMYYLVKSSKLVIFHKAGHLSNIEKAEEFNDAIENHIKSYRTTLSNVS